MIHKEEIPDSMLFAGIHPEEKESILKCLSAVEKKYEKGDIIFLAGTEIRSMGFILSGRVEISRDDFWGNRQVLGHGETGELFGEAYACMPGEVLMVNVVAAEKSRILFLDLGRILNVCTPACSHHIASGSSTRCFAVTMIPALRRKTSASVPYGFWRPVAP